MKQPLKNLVVLGLMIFVAGVTFYPSLPVDAQLKDNTEGWSSSFEGGRGLMYMNSARTYGKGRVVAGLQGLIMPREYLMKGYPKGSYEDNTTAVYGIPITFGLTDELDITGALYYFNDARPFLNQNNVLNYYGKATKGLGSARVAVKGRLPLNLSQRIQFAGKAGATFDTAEEQLDGLNHRWSRTATDFDLSFLETIDLAPIVSLHLEEGYVLSGDDYYDDQWVFAAGLEVRPHERFSLGLEVHNRTFANKSPLSALQDDMYGKYPQLWAQKDGVRQIGDPRYMLDDKFQFDEDFMVVAPSINIYVTPSVALNAGVVINVADQDDPKETAQYNVGITFNGRLSFLIDTDKDGVKDNKDREQDTPPGYPVDMYGVSLDTDGDGVVDGRDREINTPSGAKIDQYGVGLDGDRDGVYDGLDKQPDTPPGCKVDEYGIAIDTDNDGVPDCLDREINTREGCDVDEYGVALDDDEDGVPNCIDREKNTPIGCKGQVDDFGVAFDDDGDGVANCVDVEPDTPAGTPVDRFGRGIKEEEKALLDEGIIRIHRIHFATGKANISRDSNDILEQVANLFEKYPTLKIRIKGHTDITGSRNFNLNLSQKRAQAVLDFILAFKPSLDRSRFTVIGIGPDEPVAPNDTEFGRQQNRRVEFEVVNKEELRKLQQ